jgi:2'-5' RNA ligase
MWAADELRTDGEDSTDMDGRRGKIPENAPMDSGPGRCSVFLTPAADDFAYLDLLIRETSARYDLAPFEPHVTVYSGVFPDPDLLRNATETVVAGVSPITLTVYGIGYTPDYFKTLFIEFEEHQILRVIHDWLKEECCGVSSYELAPHLSLLYAELPLTFKEALARRTVIDRGEFRFDEVKIVTPLNREQGWRDTMQWKTIYRKKLAGKTGE